MTASIEAGYSRSSSRYARILASHFGLLTAGEARVEEADMPDIYTTQWYDALRDLLNRNPDVAKSAPRGGLKVLGELRGDGRSPYLSNGEQRFFVVHLHDGKCTDYYQVDKPPPRKEFDFIFEIPAAIFEEVAAGLADPVAAGLKGTIKVTGDMRILIRHADLVNVVQQVYAREVETSWPKGKPPYGK